MIGPTTKKVGMPFNSLILKVEGVLDVVERFSLEIFILALVNKTILVLEHGFGLTIGFLFYVVYFRF